MGDGFSLPLVDLAGTVSRGSLGQRGEVATVMQRVMGGFNPTSLRVGRGRSPEQNVSPLSCIFKVVHFVNHSSHKLCNHSSH